MQMTGYELLANYEKAEDKDKQIQILADLNHIPVDMVCFVIDNREKFENLETPLSTEEFAMYTESQVHTEKECSCMREGTGNFQNGDLLYMATHPVADAIRIGRTKPYDCSYPVMAERPRIKERSKNGKNSRD